MKILISAIVSLLVVFASGCAVRQQYGVNIPPPTKPRTQAEVNALIEGQYLADVANQELWKGQLQLDCNPRGGRENVIIEPRLGKEAYRVQGGTKAFIFARTMGLVEVTNPYLNATVTIREGSRFQVHHLCPGGTMTLVVLLPPDTNMFVGMSPSGQGYQWTADVYMDGKLFKGKSAPMDLWVYAWERERKGQWIIELDNIGRILK